MNEARAKLTQAILAVRNNAGMITPEFRDDMRRAKTAAREVILCDLAALAGQIEMAGDQTPMDLHARLFAGMALYTEASGDMRALFLTDQIRRASEKWIKGKTLMNGREEQNVSKARAQWDSYFRRLERDASAFPPF